MAKNNRYHQFMSNFFEPFIEKWLPIFFSPLYKAKINPDKIKITELKLWLPHLPAAFEGFRLMQISDLHVGTWITEERLWIILEKIRGLEKDCLAFTGDMVSYQVQEWVEPLTTAFSQLVEDTPVYAVFGNHDYWSNSKLIMKILEESGVTLLNNQVAIFQRGNTEIIFAGVDDLWENKDDLPGVQAKIKTLSGDNASDPTCIILLSHEPDIADDAAATGLFCLQISGHSHGGQFVLPWVGPLLKIPGSYKYPLGLYQVEDMFLYTNRGLGTSTVPLRINCPPEIAIFTLHKKRENQDD